MIIADLILTKKDTKNKLTEPLFFKKVIILLDLSIVKLEIVYYEHGFN